MPTLDQVETAQHSVVLDKVRETVSQGGLESYAALIDSLVEGEVTASDVAAALLKMTLPQQQPNATPVRLRGARRGGLRQGPARRPARISRSRSRSRRQAAGAAVPRVTASAGSPGRKAGEGPAGKLFLNIGKFQGARPKDILGALAGETGLAGNIFGDIQVFPKHTLVEIPEEYIEEVLTAFHRVRIKGISVKARRAEF